ncbi:MAG: hypothetical protein ACRD1L_13635, partial [Terriglobales bacterium]
SQAYWLRRPYLGIGLDAHSFLAAPQGGSPRRFANPDLLPEYMAPLRAARLPRLTPQWLTPAAEEEERYFLGLRRNAGVALPEAAPAELETRVQALVADGLLARQGRQIALTPRGRLLSNQVLAEFLAVAPDAAPGSQPAGGREKLEFSRLSD